MMDHNDVLKKLKESMKPDSKGANNQKDLSRQKSRQASSPQVVKKRKSKRRAKVLKHSATPTYSLIGPPQTKFAKPSIKMGTNSSHADVENSESNDFLAEIDPPNRDGLEDYLNSKVEAIQFLEHLPNYGKPIDMYIGLDFGTAFTKVVIGEVVYKYILEFSTGDTLLPSRVWIDSDGRCRLKKFGNSKPYEDLKMPLLSGTSTEIDRALIVAFVALVLAECRNWFKKSTYKDRDPTWFINCGLPTESTGNETTKSIFSDLVFTAWILSYCEIVSLQNAAHILNSISMESSFPNHVLVDRHEQINLYPEFIAQLTGYTNSPRRRPYSHLLLDIGAGTIDISAFCIQEEDGAAVYKVVAEDVKNLGVKVLNRFRLKKTNSPLSKLHEIRERPDNEVAPILGISQEELDFLDKPFSNLINRLVARIIREIKSGALNFEAATIILCGGGKSVLLYRKALEPVERDFDTTYAEISPIENLEGPEQAMSQYHRYSVAAGLCDDPFNISAMQRQKIEKISNSERSKRLELFIERARTEMYKG